ncbi:unnamed protein product [Schistosoma margrebowiei]|uniref:ALMS_motif domain-containing protein n=1 Tax=Schistosoma margrebowiei TaxID=48269 RepID=A0AA84ZGM8_9TREM|nr:unnamed protein product [Schistosoma margrebowiei]
MHKPSDSQNTTSSCELFTPYGITPGLVKQVREKFQSEISMNELSRNIHSGVKHHSATARLTCAYQNLLHNDNGIQRHNTYPNRRIQSTGRVSDMPTPASLTVYKVNGRPRAERLLDTLKSSRESFTSQVSVGESGKCTAPVHPNEYRTQTAITGHGVENKSRYNNVPSNISSVERGESFPINHNLLNSNENQNKPKESEASSSTKNSTRTDFKQPAILPKPSKSELSKDSLVNFMIPRGYEGSKRSSQYVYSADEHSFSQKSENPPSEKTKNRSLQGHRNTTIRINTRNHTIADPFARLSDSYPNHTTIKSKNPSNINSASDSWGKDDKGDKNKVSSKFNKSNRPSEYIDRKKSTAGDTTQAVTEPVRSNSVCPCSSHLNGDPYHTTRSVIVNDPKTTKPISKSVTSSSLSSTLQSFHNIHSERNFSQVRRNRLQSENSSYSGTEDSSLSLVKPEKPHQDLNDKDDTDIFTAVRAVPRRSTVCTAKRNSLMNKSKLNLPAETNLYIKDSELPGNITSKKVNTLPTDNREAIKSATADMNFPNVSTNELGETSKNIVVGQIHTEDAEKTFLGENNSHHKANEKMSNLPYHKRQINYTILDSVMGEMEQLFSGKQTNTQRKLSRIHSFAREKAMQCREEKENNEDNCANDSNLVKTSEASGLDNKSTANGLENYSNVETISSVSQPKNERQSESFQAAFRAVEKHLKLFSGTEDSQSLKPSKISNDISENIIKNGNNSQLVCPATEKRPGDPCNPIHGKSVTNNDDKFKKHQNAFNQFNSIKITTSTKESVVQNDHVIADQNNDINQLVDCENRSDSSVTDSQQLISHPRTLFPRPQWSPNLSYYMWSSIQNNQTSCTGSYDIMNRSISNTDGINTDRLIPAGQISQTTRHFPRLSTAEIPCERPKSAPVKNCRKKINLECKTYSVHYPGLLANGNMNIC